MKIRILSKQATPQATEHDALGLPPVEDIFINPNAHLWRRTLITFLVLMPFALTLLWHNTRWLPQAWLDVVDAISSQPDYSLFYAALFVGFGAQMIDGALGMAYGITANTFLLSVGVPPAAATASVHLAEVFTTGFSGLSHWRFGNVDKKLFRKILIPGIIGVIIGSYIITSIDGKMIKPWISLYLLGMGIWILYKAFKKHVNPSKKLPRLVGLLALTGGFVDSVGGGGWGPVVTTSLVGRGHNPKLTIGSVNTAEFFLALTGAISFSILGAFTHWQTILGLVVGGLFAAPFAAWLCHKLSAKTLLLLVGILISTLSIFNLYKAFM